MCTGPAGRYVNVVCDGIMQHLCGCASIIHIMGVHDVGFNVTLLGVVVTTLI